MDEYISKPLETTELLIILNKFLSDKIVNQKGEAVEADTKATSAAPEPTIAAAEPEKKEEETIALHPEAEPETNEAPKGESARKILIAKRSLLESRILARIIENLNLEYKALDSLSDLEKEAASGKYDILIADQDLLPEDLSKIEESVAIIALSDNNSDQEAFNVARGESLPQSLSKEKIEALIKKYRG
jgi:DNA-binding response OmpR family regulator